MKTQIILGSMVSLGGGVVLGSGYTALGIAIGFIGFLIMVA